MAIARHLAIDRRITGLAKENAELSDDIGKLENALKLHQKLTAERQDSVKGLIRKEIGGPIWQRGAKGRMKNYKNKKEISETTKTAGLNTGRHPSSNQLSDVRSPTIVLDQTSVTVSHAKNTLKSDESIPIIKEVSRDSHMMPVDMPPKKPVVRKDMVSEDLGLEPKVSGAGRMPRQSRAVSKHFRSLSARGSRKKPLAEKTAPDIDTLQGQALDLSSRFTTSVSDSEEERSSVKNGEQKPYEEKVSELKQKVLNKVLSSSAVEKKLKNYKTSKTDDTSVVKHNKPVLPRNENASELTVKSSDMKHETVSKTSIETISSESQKDLQEASTELDVWIMELNLKDPCKYRNILKQNEITPQILLTMTDLDLKRIGVENAIVLSKIKRGLSKLKSVKSKPKELPERVKGQEKYDSAKLAINIEDTKSKESLTQKLSEKGENERGSSEVDTAGKCESVKGEAQELLVNEKLPPSMGFKGGKKTAWGAGPGLRSAPNSQSVRSRPSSAGPKIKSRPASAKSGKLGILKRGPPPRPQSASGFGKKNHVRTLDPDVNVKDDIYDGSKSQREKSARGSINLANSGNHSELKITGANLASPGRSQADGSVSPPDSKGSENFSSRASTARLAIETMESQIAILQKEASMTGDASTMALIAQLQGQLVQIQQAVTLEVQERGSTGVQDYTPPPAAGNLVTAALEGNVRPMAFKHPAVSNDDDETYQDGADLNTLPPALSQAGPPRRSNSASGNRGKAMGGPLSMSMSKQAILKEVRKQKEEHRRTVRHLESELARLKHKDPLRSSEVAEEDIEYGEMDLIGEGAFSQVFCGMFQGTQVAVKRLKVPLGTQDKNYFIAEVNLLRELRHPRVVLLMGVCTSSHLPLMVLEFMDGGSLYGYLHDDNCPTLDHAAYYQVAQDIAVGMNYLHRHRPTVLHLDLKSMNVLLQSNLRAKIADFGFSKLRHDAELAGSQRGGVKGTPAWMAPELLGGGDITTKADVYSYGIILWEMITRRRPYQGCSMFQVIERVRNNRRPEIPEDTPDGLSAVVNACWEQLPSRRPSFQEVLHYLEELHLPPEWKSLFAAAGLPKVALDDIEATRSLIDIVSQTIETGQLPSLPKPTENQQKQDDQVSKVQKNRSHTIQTNRVGSKKIPPGAKGSARGKAASSNSRVNNTKSKGTDVPPPPPLPPPPPPVPPPGGFGNGAEPRTNVDPRPAPNINFMDQLKAGLQEIQLKPTVFEEMPSVPVQKLGQSDNTRANGAAPKGLFSPDATQLVSQRNRLRSAIQPHPSQLQDLSKASEGTISGLAEVLRRAVNERRTALNAGMNSVDLSQQSYIDSGWSID